MELAVDKYRWEMVSYYHETGIFVRAMLPDGDWDSVDIIYLDKESVLEWLRSRGDDNEFAEDVVLILLGHK